MVASRKRDSKGRYVASNSRSTGKEVVVNAQKDFELRTLSAVVSRLQLAARAGLQYDGERDLYQVFGYKTDLRPEDFLAKYIRQDVASRIVDAPPGATWSNPPTIKEGSPIIDPWDKVVKSVKLWNAMFRADRLARLNPFSILLFGFNDGGGMAGQVSKASDLLYVRAIGSRQVEEIILDRNIRSARFGMPNTYKIKFDDPNDRSVTGIGSTAGDTKELTVHHSRVVHIAENPLEDMVFGVPIMERVYNLLDDLLKVAGGSAETYWLTSNRGMQADIDKEMNLEPGDAEELEAEIDEYMHQLRRFIRTRGVKLNVLDSTTVNPKEPFEVIMSLISGTTGIPRRILLGAEAGQLASEQDRANWAERIEERRALFCTPWILEPTLALLQTVGLIPEGEVEWIWPSAFIQNPLEQGQTMAQQARAIGNMSRQTGNATPMQITSEEESRNILGLEGKIPDSERFIIVDPNDDGGGGDDDDDEDTRETIEDEDADQ